MKQDDERKQRRMKGRRSTVMKTTGLFFIYYTRLKGNNERRNLEMGLYWGCMVFVFGSACFRSCVRPLWMEFLSSNSAFKLELPFKMKLHPSMLAQVQKLHTRSLDANLIIVLLSLRTHQSHLWLTSQQRRVQ